MTTNLPAKRERKGVVINSKLIVQHTQYKQTKTRKRERVESGS